jgi:small subunit ribosomal protein S20
MPNIKSVKKDVLRSRERQLRNQAAKSQIKTLIKKARVAIDGRASAEEVTPLVVAAVSLVDRAVKRGIIHKNAAARRKSRLAKRVNATTAA